MKKRVKITERMRKARMRGRKLLHGGGVDKSREMESFRGAIKTSCAFPNIRICCVSVALGGGTNQIKFIS